MNNIILSGEAILSAENSVKPLSGRSSARTPLGELTAPHLAGGEGLLSLPMQEPHPRSRPSALWSCPPMKKSWVRPSHMSSDVTQVCYAVVTTTIRLRFVGRSTSVRLLIGLSEVIKVTVTQPASRSHAYLFIYLGRSAGPEQIGRNVECS